MNETELSKHIWNLKDHGLDNNVSWKIHKKASPFQCGSKLCNLCLSEEISLISADPETLRNTGTELISKRSQKIKFLLANTSNCYSMVFNYLPQFLFKDTEQN